jgi:hypothetical protein
MGETIIGYTILIAKPDEKSCSVYINRKAEDASDVRQRDGTFLILVIRTGQEHNSL